MSLIKCFFCFLLATTASAETFLDSNYRRLYEVFSGKNCDQIQGASTALNCFDENLSKKNIKDLNLFTETLFFSKLADLEIQRLQCGTDYWKSLSQPENKKTFLNLINEKLPYLNKIKKVINDLSVRNALLKGKIPNNIYPHLQNMKDPYKPLREEFEANNLQIKNLTALYETILARIPHSEIPIFREFIESKAGTNGLQVKDVRQVNDSEFIELTSKVTNGFTQSIKNLSNRKTGPDIFNLDESQREQLGTDSFLVSQLIKDQPQSISLIEKYKCQMLHKQKGKKGLWDGVSYLGMALGLGSPAIISVARVAWLARTEKLAETSASVGSFSNASRIAGYTALFTGVGSSFKELNDLCFKDNSSSIKASCSQTPQTLFTQKEVGHCLLSGALLAITQATGPVEKIMKMSSPMAKVVGEIKIGLQVKGKTSAIDLAEGSNKLRLQADQLSQTNPATAAIKYKEAIADRVIKKEFSLVELSDIEYSASRWGSLTKDAKESAEAEKKYIEAYKKRLSLEYESARKIKRNPLNKTSDNFKGEYTQDYIDRLMSDKGKGNYVTTTNWQIEVLKKFLRDGMR